MLNGFVVLIIGTSLIDLMSLFLYKTGRIRYLRQKDGSPRKSLSAKGLVLLVYLGILSGLYLLLADMLILGVNDHHLLIAWLFNQVVVVLVLAYYLFVVEHWFILGLRPRFLPIVFDLTVEGDLAYRAKVTFYGVLGGALLSLLIGFIYTNLVNLI